MSARIRVVASGALALLLVILPFVASEFFVVQIVVKTMWLGAVAATLTFLVRFGGMVSLAQTAVYGFAGYIVAALSVTYGVDGWLAALGGVLGGTVLALVIGVISSRTTGIYFLMLTLAAGVLVYYFTLQDRTIAGGFGGINGVQAPAVGAVSFADPLWFYFLAVVVAVGAYAALTGYARTPLGLALQGVRDSRERMQAVGFHPATVRVLSFVFAGIVASAAGIIAVWYNGRISPGSLDLARTFDVLIVAVLGGITRIEGAWLGAFVVVLLQNSASDFTDRYNTLIGVIFVVVVMASRSGILGLPAAATDAFHRLTQRDTAPKEGKAL